VEDIYAPVTGTVVAANTDLVDTPEIIGEDPYDDGWLIKIKYDDAGELVDAMNASQYESMVGG
jgi:glycine cleavage system H protein